MTAMLRSSSERFVFKLGRQAFSTLATNEVRLPPLFTKVGTRLNPHTAWQWRGRNLSGYLEYFRNGFGRSDRGYTLVDLSAELNMRLTRGQLFNTGRDYFVGGLRLEWTSLLTLNPLLMLNLNDRSALLFMQGDYSGARRGVGVWQQYRTRPSGQRIRWYRNQARQFGLSRIAQPSLCTVELVFLEQPPGLGAPRYSAALVLRCNPGSRLSP